MKNWYSIENKAGSVDISIHDEIGLWGVTAKEFITDIKQYPDAKAINLSIHSPGGSVLDGMAIYNALKHHPAKVYGKVEGIAASAASFILMAADVITMPEDAFIMIHNAHGGAMGDADDLREMADIIEKLQDQIVSIYERRTGVPTDELRQMMAAETWMNATEALEKGFADTILEPVGVAAKATRFDRYFKSMPESERVGVENIDTITDFEKYLRDTGNSRKEAKAIVSVCKQLFSVDAEQAECEPVDVTDYSALRQRIDALANRNFF